MNYTPELGLAEYQSRYRLELTDEEKDALLVVVLGHPEINFMHKDTVEELKQRVKAQGIADPRAEDIAIVNLRPHS